MYYIMVDYKVFVNQGVEAFGTSGKTLSVEEQPRTISEDFLADAIHSQNELIPKRTVKEVLSIFGRVIFHASKPKKPKNRMRKMTASKLRFVVKRKGRFSFRSSLWNNASTLFPYESVLTRWVLKRRWGISLVFYYLTTL